MKEPPICRCVQPPWPLHQPLLPSHCPCIILYHASHHVTIPVPPCRTIPPPAPPTLQVQTKAQARQYVFIGGVGMYKNGIVAPSDSSRHASRSGARPTPGPGGPAPKPKIDFGIQWIREKNFGPPQPRQQVGLGRGFVDVRWGASGWRWSTWVGDSVVSPS